MKIETDYLYNLGVLWEQTRPETPEFYSEAHELLSQWADTYGVELHTVAGIVAVLSPQMLWKDQLRETPLVLDAFKRGLDRPDFKSRSFPINQQKAYRVWLAPTMGEAESIISGPKVSAFYLALMGDPNSVTLDSHAINAAFGGKLSPDEINRLFSKKDTLEQIREAYLKLAKAKGTTPADAQARIWEVQKTIGRITKPKTQQDND